MSNLATRVKRLSRNLIPYALATTTAFSLGCGGKKEKISGPEDNPTLITQPVKASISYGTTNENGLVSFLDKTAEDGKAEARVMDPSHQPLEGFSVKYEDSPNSKVFTAIDTTEQFLPTRDYSPHNSPHDLFTAPSRDGIVHAQTIKDEEGFRAFYIWERNPELASNPYSRFEYVETIDAHDVLSRREFNSKIITLIELAEKASGGSEISDAILEVFGISVDVSVTDLARHLDPYREREVEAKRWDVYSTSNGIKLKRPDGTFLEREIVGDVLIVPSNIPEVELNPPEVNGNSIRLTWSAFDDTVYRFPFELPDKKDLTVLLGPTKSSDLFFIARVENKKKDLDYNSLSQSGNSKEAVFRNLPNGEYYALVSTVDEAKNVSYSERLEFRIGETINSSDSFSLDDLIGKILFTSNRDGGYAVYAMNPDGSGVRNVIKSDDHDMGAASLSPDGRKIVFASNRDGDFDIYTVDADGNNKRNLTNNQYHDFGPRWSPDGTKIIYTSHNDARNDGIGVISVMNADGSGQKRLTSQGYSSYCASWSPDGTKIAYLSDGSNIHIMDEDGSNNRTIIKDLNNGHITYSSWSPDGTKIGFVMWDGNSFEIFAVNTDGTNITNLTRSPGQDMFPFWSRDGAKIAFMSDRDGNFEIYTMNADGSGQKRLTYHPGDDNTPSW